MKYFEKELQFRASKYCLSKRLTVDFYRIRSKLALQLPLKSSSLDGFPVRGFIAQYPWDTWTLWALEDRVLNLGSSVQLVNVNCSARVCVESDLAALAHWETYRTSNRIDLPYAHVVRILWFASTWWSWMGDPLRSTLLCALHFAVDDALSLADKRFVSLASGEDLADRADVYAFVHNIELIGAVAIAMAARVSGHPAADRLDERVIALKRTVLNLRRTGFTEGVSYDGYVLSFLADWLHGQPSAVQALVLDNAEFGAWVRQVIEIAAPGAVMQSAPFGDVEPMEMAFVWSAMAKLQVIRPDPVVMWALARCPPARLQADALAALLKLRDVQSCAPVPQTVPSVGKHVVTLRSGHTWDDMAVAMAVSTSPMNHIQCDAGSLVLGTRGCWWLDDPGYQQYLDTAERVFTVGIAAHNTPVISGHSQAYKRPRLISAEPVHAVPNVKFALVDLTACYPKGAGARRVRRATWLVGSEHLVVCDEIDASALTSVAYHWHGNPSLYWCLLDGAATMVSDDDPDRWLHVFSPQIELSPADLKRLPGSRGQQTLALTLYPPLDAAVWWIFSFSAQRPAFQLTDKAFLVGGLRVEIDELLLPLLPMQPLTRNPPLLEVTATRQGNALKGQCVANAQHFSGELKYAFYLMVGGKKAVVQWYTPSPDVTFVVPDEAGEESLEIRGFVREKANPAKKLMGTAALVSGFIRDRRESH